MKIDRTKQAVAYLRHARISPRKVSIVLDLIRGKDVGVAMGMGNAVVGMLMGVRMLVRMGMLMAVVMAATGNMVVMDVHSRSSLSFSFIISGERVSVKTFISAGYPPGGLA